MQEANPVAYDLVVMTDNKTGQPLFKPQILSHRGKSTNGGKASVRDELDPRHINEYLYRHGQIMRMKKQMKEELVRKQEVEEYSKRHASASQNSRYIFERKLRQKLAEIFDQLRGDGAFGSDRIAADTMYRDSLPSDLVKVFDPLFREMDEYGETLDLDEFVESSLVLLKGCTVAQRGLVLGYGAKRERQSMAVEDDFQKRTSFKPTISATSKEMAKKFYERRQAYQESQKNK